MLMEPSLVLDSHNLNSIKLCKPTRELIIRFSEQVSNIVEMYLQNESNIEELTKQRDELLPLLMNGQVSVNSDLSVYKKRRGKVPSSILNDVSDI